MRLLATVFASGTDFLSQHSENYPYGAVFCPTKANLAVGERVLLEIQFPTLPNPAVVRGSVVSSVHGRGALVACESPDRARFGFVVDAARGELSGEGSLVRHHPRFPAQVPVKFRVMDLGENTRAVTATTADLGSGGAYIRSSETLKVGTRINLRLVTTDCGPIEVAGRVAWSEPGSGFGLRFDQRGPASAAPLRPLIRRIRETGELPLWANACSDPPTAKTAS